MAFEGDNGESGMWQQSPGGFEFGIQGWNWNSPVPRSITFFLDGSAMVCDQYGRKILRAVDGDKTIRFADSPPAANLIDTGGGIATVTQRRVEARPQFASHAQTIAALIAEKFDWLHHEVRWKDKTNQRKLRGGLTLEAAQKEHKRIAEQGIDNVIVARTIQCAGWPQLPYEELKKVAQFLPPTPEDDLRKIPDKDMRTAALKMRREIDEARDRELAAEGE